MPGAPIADQRAMFHIMVQFYWDAADRIRLPITNMEIRSHIPSPRWGESLVGDFRANTQFYKATRAIVDCGFGIYYGGEGSYVISLDSPVFESFAPILPPDEVAWIRLRKSDGFGPYASDGHIKMSWTNLARRLIRWERLQTLHPSLSKPFPDIDEEIRFMAFALFRGMDNWRVDVDGGVEPEALAAWKLYVAQTPSTKYKPTMLRILNSVRANGGKYPPHIQSLSNWIEEAWTGRPLRREP